MAVSEEDRRRMGTPHPELLAALEKAPFPDLTQGNPEAPVPVVRKNRAEHLARLRHLYPIPGPIPDGVREVDHHVPARDGTSIPVRIYLPTRSNEDSKGRPLVVMFHEGGWRMGDLTDEDQNCRMFARDLGAVCVNVDYRLAPEHKFPTGVNDAYDVVQWCAKTATPSSDVLPADPKQGFLVGGASAGGNFAAIMCQIARDEQLLPPLTGQYLCVPALLDSSVVPEKWKADYRSRTESVHDPIIKPTPNRNQNRQDVLGITNPEDPSYSPLLHPNLTGLPPAYLQLGGLDPLRDEALIYERELRKSGTPTRLEVYDGFGHMWDNTTSLERNSADARILGSGRTGQLWKEAKTSWPTQWPE